MILFAAPIGGLLHLIILLVVFGVWVINALTRKRDEEDQGPVQRRQTRPSPPVRAGVNPMEPQDVDQFLDEVLGRGRPAQPPGQPPVAQPPNVIVLRPGAAPPPPQRRQPQRRPPRPAVQRPTQPRLSGQPQPPVQPQAPKRSAFAQSINESVDQAAAATGSAGAATTEAAALKDSSRTAGRQLSIGNEILAMLRSPADVRRALVLREILGTPLALRRRRR